ncbi:MAG: hypothetical protein KZQ99_03485 [Candidatus Thiodiazotropha sp. (ex Dulcina madagascariensis)]|nr:hypothetical protein [Candidatus Thiodiazotropha sp. (ex Dulcina madagascariensis)]
MKALGLVALILAVICVFVPISWPYLTILSAAFAVASYGPGITLGIAAIALNIINVIFLSPALWMAEAGARIDSSPLFGPVVVVVAIQVFAAIVLFIVHKKMKGRIMGVNS